MKTIGYLVLVAVTQAVPPLALVRLSHAWSGSHSISIAAVDRLTVPILLIGASGLVLGARGIYPDPPPCSTPDRHRRHGRPLGAPDSLGSNVLLRASGVSVLGVMP